LHELLFTLASNLITGDRHRHDVFGDALDAAEVYLVLRIGIDVGVPLSVHQPAANGIQLEVPPNVFGIGTLDLLEDLGEAEAFLVVGLFFQESVLSLVEIGAYWLPWRLLWYVLKQLFHLLFVGIHFIIF